MPDERVLLRRLIGQYASFCEERGERAATDQDYGSRYQTVERRIKELSAQIEERLSEIGGPIETAPHDTRVLIGPVTEFDSDGSVVGKRIIAARWGWNALHTREGWFTDDGYLLHERERPSHWWALPKLPEVK